MSTPIPRDQPGATPPPDRPDTNEPAAGGERLPRGYVRNLVSIGLLGIAAYGWFYRYTDWYDVIGGLLALGGIFSWLAFVSKILSDERLKALQDWADRAILAKPATVRLVFWVGVALAVAASFFGTIQLEALHAGGAVWVENADAPRGQESGWELLPAGGQVRSLVWAPLWSLAKLRVSVSGLPERRVTVWPWTRVELQVPDDFRRPVLLLRPEKTLAQIWAQSPVFLIITVGTQSYRVKFHGKSLWVGCDAGVEVPAQVVEQWRVELASAPGLLSRWLQPEALDAPGWEPRPRERIHVEIKKIVPPDNVGDVYACPGSFTIPDISERTDFRKQVVVNVRDTSDPNCPAGQMVEVTTP